MAAQQWAPLYSSLLDMAGSVDIDLSLMKTALTYAAFATLPVKTQSIYGPHVGSLAGSDMQFENYVKMIIAASHLINLLCGQSRN